MSFISDLLINVSAFRITIGNKINALKTLIDGRAKIDGSNIPYITHWTNLHAGGLDNYVFHGSDVGSAFESVLVISQGAIFRTNKGGFRTWVGIGTMSDLTTTHKTDLVGAINEVNGYIFNLNQQYHNNFNFLETINQHVNIGSNVQFGKVNANGGNSDDWNNVRDDALRNYLGHPTVSGLQAWQRGYAWFNGSVQGLGQFTAWTGCLIAFGDSDHKSQILVSKNRLLFRTNYGANDDDSFKEVFTDQNFNPATKADSWDNATAIGFSNSSFSGLPYFWHKTGGFKYLATIEYINNQDYASVNYVNNAINNAVANIPVHNGQLTVNTTADLVGGFTYLPSGNVTTTLGLATHILNAIADGQAAYNFGNHATQGYLKIADLAPYETTISVNNKLTAKQDKLIAGANVSIVGNTISATDTVTRIGVWGGNYTSGDINFTATGAATIVKNGNNINIDVTNSGGIPNPGVKVLNFSPGGHVVNNQLAITIVRCTSSGTYTFYLQPGKYDGDEICITTCGYECSVGGELLSMCGTSSFGSSKASRWIWADQLAKWVQVG